MSETDSELQNLPASERRWTPRRLAVTAAVLVACLLAGVGVWRLRRVEAAGHLPTVPSRRGEFLVLVRARGALEAQRSVQLSAPNHVPNLQIVWLALPSSPVHAGDVVVRFDPSQAQELLDQNLAALRQAQATLDQEQAQARIIAEQDQLDTETAKYQVERARLEASKLTIVSAIQGEESKIDLGLAQEKQRVEAATVNLHQRSEAAKISSLRRLRDKAQFEVDQTRDHLAHMELHSPLNGIINFLQNNSQGWINAQPFKVGDHVWGGATIAEIPDMSTVQMAGGLEEVDRGRIALGNPTRVHLDALPEVTFSGHLAAISPLTEHGCCPPFRNFRAYAAIDHPDPRMRTGMNGSVDIIVKRLADVVSVPSRALFTRNAKPVVYVARNGQYVPVEVEVLARNPDEVAVGGIAGGTLVTLAEPATGSGKGSN
ncbi:MAG: efflux RND transporter periplasmic adaptor subunit [Terriglobales bacterium]